MLETRYIRFAPISSAFFLSLAKSSGLGDEVNLISMAQISPLVSIELNLKFFFNNPLQH